MISRRFNRFESYFMASACASAPRSLRSTGASLTRLDCPDGDEGLHYAFIGAYFVAFGEQKKGPEISPGLPAFLLDWFTPAPFY